MPKTTQKLKQGLVWTWLVTVLLLHDVYLENYENGTCAKLAKLIRISVWNIL